MNINAEMDLDGELFLDFDFVPGYAGCFSGHPDNWEPPEPASVKLNRASRTKDGPDMLAELSEKDKEVVFERMLSIGQRYRDYAKGPQEPDLDRMVDDGDRMVD